MMNQPQGIKQAVIAIWVSLLLSAFVAVADKHSGNISSNEFMGNLIVYGLFCIVPYKISNGSNPARYIFTILTVFGYLFWLGGDVEMSKLNSLVSIVIIPIDLFVIYKLFTGEANGWFFQAR